MNKCMLTIFTVPKPFRGNFETIQYNAIKSWKMLEAGPDIILLGDDFGTGEMAAELGALHIRDIETTPAGTPLIDSIFGSARANTETPWLAYINCDCILLDDFSASLSLLQQGLKACSIPDFLLGSQRIEIDVGNRLSFNDPGWRTGLVNDVTNKGVRDSKTANEIFLFNRDLFDEIPPFAIGRPCWDNWMVWYAWKKHTAVIDATEAFMVIHQCHDYTHVAGGWQAAWKGEEAQRNLALASGRFMSLNLACTHVLDRQGLRPGRLEDGSMRDSLVSRRLGRGMDEFNQGRYCEALDYFNDALARSGSLYIESLHLIRAICLTQLNRRTEAREALENELAANSGNQEARRLLMQLNGEKD
jgi:hypothetical protein